MVYAGQIGERKLHLGVSGRLMDNNLIMWDEETNSLWSQILGEAIYGPSKGDVLDMLPAIFVGLGTWARMHPDSLVLNMSTVRQRGWFFTNEDLARGAGLGIGLRHGGDTLAVPMTLLRDKGLVQVEVDGIPLAVVWHAGEKAALVYRRDPDGRAINLELQGDELVAGDRRWHVLTGKPAGSAEPLSRFPYVPSYVRAWRSYYPEGRVLN